MQGQSLGQGDPLEEGKATDSSILAWRISQAAEPGGLQSTGLQRDTTKRDLTRMHALMLSHFSRV